MKKRLFSMVAAVVFVTAPFSFAQMEKGMGPGMMKSGQPEAAAGAPEGGGAKIFADSCSGCHPDGGNVIVPTLPLKGSRVLANFRAFIAFLRHPKMPDGSQGAMPSFSKSQISDHDARKLYHYIASGKGPVEGGYGKGRAMMGGYGMGRGMMGGYGMGPGMMGGYGMGAGYYTYSPECQKFYDETAVERKELHEKKFDYFEAVRNPKTTGEAAEKREKEIRDLQEKIYSKAPLGCRW
ncbi:MAG: c-type cytochrome [Nitrospiraceae bacterium]|nr:c-type cytochrome [Nitrospiraceae bacterium]